MEKKKEQKLLTAYQVQKILQMPLSTIYYFTKTGAIKSLRFGRHVKYNKEDIENYRKNGLGESTFTIDDKIPYQPRERRRYSRINCALECDCIVDLPQFKNITLPGTIRNISTGGCFMNIVQSTDIKNDDPIDVCFCIKQPYEENKGEEIRILGRIVRQGDNGVGVKYRSLPEQMKEKIIRYIG